MAGAAAARKRARVHIPVHKEPLEAAHEELARRLLRCYGASVVVHSMNFAGERAPGFLSGPVLLRLVDAYEAYVALGDG